MGKATCSIEDCDRSAKARGWCMLHYKRWRSTGTTDRDLPTCSLDGCDRPQRKHGRCEDHYRQWIAADPDPRCTIDGCSRKLYGRGWCAMHWKRFYTTGSTELRPRVDEPCAVDGCERTAKKRGWCETHYTRWRKNGTQELQRPQRTTCSVDGCDALSQAHGWCGTHYARWRKHGSVDLVPRAGRGVCSAEGCDRTTQGRGLCSTHYGRWRRANGLDAIRPPSQQPQARRAYYTANAERIRATRRTRYQTDPEYREAHVRKARETRASNPEKHRERDRKRRAQSLVVRAKNHIGRCLRCGFAGWTGALQWAHVDASTKTCEPASLTKASDEVAYQELAKCVLLCANCHWEEGAGIWSPGPELVSESLRLLNEALNDPPPGVRGSRRAVTPTGT